MGESKSHDGRDRLEKLIKRRGSSPEPGDPGEALFTPRITATFSEKALRTNYRAISEQVPKLSMLPMIKANAYGHGAAWAARILAAESTLYGLGVATLEEGQEIRAALGPKHRKLPVIVFSAAAPWSETKGQFCESWNLTPVIASDSDWKSFLKGGWAQKLSYELKFNTGMNRLGLSLNTSAQILRDLKSLKSEHLPAAVMSHLAQAESPDTQLSQAQLRAFREIRSQFSGALPAAHFHLANSSAIWNQKYFDLSGLTDVVRPGLSLYGVPPWAGAPARGIEPVLTLTAQILTTRKLKRGDQVGYGGAYKVTGEDPAYIAILGAGYADGLPRALGNRGHAWVERPERFLGIVSMDLSAVSCTPKTREGQWVEILGPQVDIWAQAKSAETIPYELLTSLAARVKRIYE